MKCYNDRGFTEGNIMAMTNRNNAKFDSIIMFTLDELVPQDHLVRKLESALDFRFIYSKVNLLYSPHGRPSIDPVVLFKMLIINIVFGINSMRKTCQEIIKKPIISLVIFVLSIVNNVKFYYTASPIYPSDLFFLGNIGGITGIVKNDFLSHIDYVQMGILLALLIGACILSKLVTSS